MMNLKQAAVAAAVLVPGLALASTWDIDAAHARAGFSVKHMMLSDVDGTLGKVTGSIDLDDKDITKSKVVADIEVAPSTQEKKRDDHLASPDFFDVAKFPKVSFKSKKIEKAGEKLKITGDLTIKDVTKEVVLDTVASAEVTNPFTKATARAFTATTTINRQDFGLKWQVPMTNNGLLVGNDVKVTLNLEAVKKEAAPAAAPAKK